MGATYMVSMVVVHMEKAERKRLWGASTHPCGGHILFRQKAMFVKV
jgi:hypothetical protein